MQTAEELCRELFARGWIATPTPLVLPLTGGVSSDILLLDDGRRKVVLKRALPKLRVADDWQADTSRNRYEQEYLDYVGRLLPGNVPRMLERDPEHDYFLMEYLGEGYVTWKSQLLAGQATPGEAVNAGRMLGIIHRASWNDDALRQRFATTANFTQLRIDPYLTTTGRRHPKLQSQFDEEAARLAATSLALVHGDYSPKNMLIGHERLVVLDCEVAWFGDPAFDVAFLLNHLLLKALLHRTAPEPLLALASHAWNAYRDELPQADDELEQRIGRLLLMLMLARIDGKSPVEYLTSERDKQTVRNFVYEGLAENDFLLGNIIERWQDRLAE